MSRLRTVPRIFPFRRLGFGGFLLAVILALYAITLGVVYPILLIRDPASAKIVWEFVWDVTPELLLVLLTLEAIVLFLRGPS